MKDTLSLPSEVRQALLTQSPELADFQLIQTYISRVAQRTLDLYSLTPWERKRLIGVVRNADVRASWVELPENLPVVWQVCHNRIIELNEQAARACQEVTKEWGGVSR